MRALAGLLLSLLAVLVILAGAAFAAFGPFTSGPPRTPTLLDRCQVAAVLHGSRARVTDPQCGYGPSPVGSSGEGGLDLFR